MKFSHGRHPASLPSMALVLLAAFLCILWLGGGASRADVLGQALVRGGAAVVMIAALLTARRFDVRSALPVVIFLGCAVVLVLVQLLPLPPVVWTILPGRSHFAFAAEQLAPSYPLSIAPDSSWNAAASLLVPAAVLMLSMALHRAERSVTVTLVLAWIAAAMLMGWMQLTGLVVDNPLINETPGVASGIFANRNHFSLFLALGCLVAPVWALRSHELVRWRVTLAIGLVSLFLLTAIASGSRMGILLATLGTMLSLVIMWRKVRSIMQRYPRWVLPVSLAGVVIVNVGLIVIAAVADRATALNRALNLEVSNDMRSRAMLTIYAMIREVFLTGWGYGSFDPAFRMHEPLALLKPSYFNHAHNDVLELVLDGGLPALLLLAGVLTWYGVMTVRAWRQSPDQSTVQARLGSAMLLLILLASIVDYPARTPVIMAVITLAGLWLNWNRRPEDAALPPH